MSDEIFHSCISNEGNSKFKPPRVVCDTVYLQATKYQM